MDDIKKQVELIAREFGNVRNVVHVDTVHDEMRLIFRIEFDSIDAAQRAIQSLRRTPVVLTDWSSSPPSHKRSASARTSCARRGRSACSSTHLRRIQAEGYSRRGRSEPRGILPLTRLSSWFERDRNRNVERIYNAMVSGDHARDNPKSTARKRWIEEPHYQSDLWEIARGRTRKVTVYEW